MLSWARFSSSKLGWALLVGASRAVCVCVCVCVNVRGRVRYRENEREFCVVGNEIFV